jgi:hypothetical protein
MKISALFLLAFADLRDRAKRSIILQLMNCKPVGAVWGKEVKHWQANNFN